MTERQPAARRGGVQRRRGRRDAHGGMTVIAVAVDELVAAEIATAIEQEMTALGCA